HMAGGGVVVPVNFAVDESLANLRQKAAQITRDVKAKPKVEWDFQELAVAQGIKKAVRAIEAERAKVRVDAELSAMGLKAVSNQVADAVRAGISRGMANFDAAGGLMATRAGSGSAQYHDRSVAARVLPTVEMTNEQKARRSLATA